MTEQTVGLPRVAETKHLLSNHSQKGPAIGFLSTSQLRTTAIRQSSRVERFRPHANATHIQLIVSEHVQPDRGTRHDVASA